jgi:hypothetical protein
LQGETLLDLARVQALAGFVEDARTSVARARSLFERKGHLVGAERAACFDYLDTPSESGLIGSACGVNAPQDRAGGSCG